MELLGIHHAAIICSNYAHSKHFYTEILKLPVIDEQYRSARDSYKLDLALPDGSQIELFSFPDAPQRPSYPEAQGLRHLAFKVADIAKAKAYLEQHGIDGATRQNSHCKQELLVKGRRCLAFGPQTKFLFGFQAA